MFSSDFEWQSAKEQADKKGEKEERERVPLRQIMFCKSSAREIFTFFRPQVTQKAVVSTKFLHLPKYLPSHFHAVIGV